MTRYKYGAYALLEQILERELLLLICHYHVNELVQQTFFETKIKLSPDIPMLDKLRDNWKNYAFISEKNMLLRQKLRLCYCFRKQNWTLIEYWSLYT